MTREEKINQLNDIFAEINEDDNAVCYLTSEDNELIESAIKALEQQPCEDCISREQAVDAVADLFEMSEYPHPYPQGKPIRLKDIKEKLKQLPSVQPKPIECEDAISRQAAIDEIKSHYRVDNDLLEAIAYKISKLPSVQPKIKTGHWIFDEILDRNYYCSECKSMGVDYWDYCPYCGCRMVEPQESEVQDERG